MYFSLIKEQLVYCTQSFPSWDGGLAHLLLALNGQGINEKRVFSALTEYGDSFRMGIPFL